MSWGKGIMIGMGTFIVFITVLITIIMSNRIDLVSENYYRDEIRFEDEIKAKNAWNASGAEAGFTTNETHLIIRLPELDDVREYDLSLSRPDNNRDDTSFHIGNTRTFLIDKSALKKGMYEYRLQCDKQGETLLTTGKYYLK